MTKHELLGSAGCPRTVAGTLPATLCATTTRLMNVALALFSAGCRKQQAGSLCSPEIPLSSFELRHSSFVISSMPADATIIEVNNLVRRFGDRAVLDDISFNVHRGETLVIMGGSGCGKSTLLRHMIGSMKPTSGVIKLFGEEITGMKEREIERVRLRFGMLFQSGALLASLTVGENVALPLVQHTDKSPDQIEEIVKQKLQMVGLTGFEDLRPDEISGGMKKRVGLARALALDPELLFSDEPTSGLDPIMTAVVDELTLSLTKGTHMTAVVVSHDMTSAFRIATRMIMLGHGSIVAEARRMKFGTVQIRKCSNLSTVS